MRLVAESPWLPLTPAQRGLYFAHRLAPDSPACTTAEVVELDGPVDADRLAAATTGAYAEHEQLRTAYRIVGEGPQQRVLADPPAGPRVLDLPDRAAAEAWLRADLARPLDLDAGETVRSALLRLTDGGTWWYHAAHHVVLDGYGAQQLLRRVAERYRGADPEPALPLADLVAADHEHPDARAFWTDRLAGVSGPSSLAGRAAAAAPSALRRSTALSPDAQAALAAGARRLGVGWPDLVVAAVGAYVARLAGLAAARVGVPLMNRTLPGVGALPAARSVCTAMNVLPVEVPATGPVGTALAAAVADQAAVRQHPFTRQEDLARQLERAAPGAQLFGPQVNVVPFDLALDLVHPDGRRASGTVRNLTAGPVEDLTVTLRGNPARRGTVRLELDANPVLYGDEALDLHLERLTHWLVAYAGAEPDTRVEDLPLLPDAERRLVVEGFNDTAVPRRSATLGERFLAQAADRPDALALVAPEGTRTYGELLAAARRVAGGLAAHGVRAGDVVGVRLPRGLALYETVHAIALLGAVYLPLDPDLPAARTAAMLEDADAVLVVDEDTALGDGPVPDATAGPDDPAYLLFTSGSTGRPKGVLVGHRAIDNRLAWMQHHLPLAPGDRVLHKTPISFDVSVWELYWPLQVGATVVVAPPGAHRDPRAVAELVVTEDVTTLHFVPSMLRAFLADPVSRERVTAGRVRTLVTSGEALTPDLVRACATWFGVAPTNLYGPTEAAVDVTVWDCSVDDATVPIGRPVWNTACYVLDDRHRPLPVGVPGELWLGGVQLAEGYVGRPDLTAERFLPDPFRPGGRMYRTGDLAAWRADGALRYLGRTDDQVKVRGQRVELGEIEAAVAGVPEVEAVAAGLVDDRLVVWFVAGGDADKAEQALREAAADRLPPSFLPQHWIPVPEVPLGTSGKTDRRRLAESAPPVAVRAARSELAPGDLLEQRVCGVLADVLDLPVVGARDDFFALGGDSLRVLRLIAALEEELGTEPGTLGLVDVFDDPTAAGLAARLAGGGRTADTGEVLTLRRGGTRAPLFLLPPAGGLGWCYTGLLRSLPADLGVHTIQAPGLADGRPEPVGSLEELAHRQLAAIRSVVGDGAFHVGGWSLGGMAAHAVATLARASGQDVGAVVLLDAYPPDQWQHLAEPTEADALVGILRLGGVEPPADPPGEPLDRGRVLELLRTGGSAVARLPEPVLEGCIASVVEASRLVRTAPPGVLDGDLTVVVATAPRPEDWLDADGWRAHVAGRVEVVPLDATHGELVRRPVADRVAEVLAARV